MDHRLIQVANKIYYDWFGNDMSPEAFEIAEDINEDADIEQYENILSAGEADAIEAALFHKRASQ